MNLQRITLTCFETSLARFN